MELIAYIIIGCITGLFARIIAPASMRMGIVRMLIIGMVGGIFGGILAGTFTPEREAFSASTPSLIGAFLGALVVAGAVTLFSRRRVHA
ncbi:MAG: GlsB/YeaQ/YmgE family stress response membrane protein [Myxococcaceae bacterium]|nr:GlsB/YeaQ/YmgE family stress response membrane protein [Myxococcaceae bacterium]